MKTLRNILMFAPIPVVGEISAYRYHVEENRGKRQDFENVSKEMDYKAFNSMMVIRASVYICTAPVLNLF